MKKKLTKKEKTDCVLLKLAFAIKDLMENECGNSGLNWLDRFMDLLNDR